MRRRKSGSTSVPSYPPSSSEGQDGVGPTPSINVCEDLESLGRAQVGRSYRTGNPHPSSPVPPQKGPGHPSVPGRPTDGTVTGTTTGTRRGSDLRPRPFNPLLSPTEDPSQYPCCTRPDHLPFFVGGLSTSVVPCGPRPRGRRRKRLFKGQGRNPSGVRKLDWGRSPVTDYSHQT